MTELERDWKDYTDRHGLPTQMAGDHPSQNGLRHLAEKTIAKACIGELDDAAKIEISRIARSCQIDTGLYSRLPGDRTMFESTDDYHGLAVISKLCDPTISKDILRYANRHLYYVNNTPRFDHRAFFMWYQRQMVGMHRAATGLEPTFIQKEWTYWTLKLTNHEQDSIILTAMLRVCVGGYSRVLDREFDLWETEVKKTYAGGMGQVLGAYFNNPHHPAVKWLWGNFGEIRPWHPPI